MPTVRYTTVNGRVIAEKRGGVRKLYRPDHLGSTIALYDNTQAKTDTWVYWPYGAVRTRTGSTPTPFQFVGVLGYFRDSSDRTYVRARIFRQILGIWQTRDPLWPDQRAYLYGRSGPSTHVDPSGRLVPVIIAGVFLVVALSAHGCERNCRTASELGHEVAWSGMLVQMSQCGLSRLLKHLPHSIGFCRGLVEEHDAYGSTDPSSNTITLDDGFFGRPFWDAFGTAVHEGLHAFCGIYNESEDQHESLREWAEYLMERCRRCPSEIVDLKWVCEQISLLAPPPSYTSSCKGEGAVGIA